MAPILPYPSTLALAPLVTLLPSIAKQRHVIQVVSPITTPASKFATRRHALGHFGHRVTVRIDMRSRGLGHDEHHYVSSPGSF